jgi:hypothetical protein
MVGINARGMEMKGGSKNPVRGKFVNLPYGIPLSSLIWFKKNLWCLMWFKNPTSPPLPND